MGRFEANDEGLQELMHGEELVAHLQELGGRIMENLPQDKVWVMWTKKGPTRTAVRVGTGQDYRTMQSDAKHNHLVKALYGL